MTAAPGEDHRARWPVHLLGPQHLDELVSLEQRAQPRPWSSKLIEEELRAADRRVWGVADASPHARWVGWLTARFAADEVWILNVAVDRSARRRGVAARLVSEAIAWARKLGAPLWLEVRAGNSGAVLLYQSAGFEEVGRRPNYYPPLGDPGRGREDALQMRLLQEDPA